MSSNGALHGADTWVSLVLSPCWPDIIPTWRPNVVSSLRICTTWENKTQALWPFGLITVSRGNKYLNWKRMIDHIGAVVPVMLIRLCVAFGICHGILRSVGRALWTNAERAISIIDLNLGNRSVTNDAETVLRKIEHYHQASIFGFKIMYRDSDGIGMGSLGTDNTRHSSPCAKPKKDELALSS